MNPIARTAILMVLLCLLTGCFNSAAEVTTKDPLVYINEILAHTDLPQLDSVELFNPTDQNLDISGWYLSDKRDRLKRIQLPENLVVPANGYLVLDESIFRQGPAGFGLSESGEAVYLSSANEQDAWTGLVAQAEFDASPNGVSFGRVGEEYVLLTEPTLGFANAEPQVGPIALVEVMFAPDTDGTQYLLFENITANSVPLYDPNYPENTWQIEGQSWYDFPKATEIAAFEKFVVAANPELMRLHTELQKFGPLNGKLKPNGDKIILTRPGNPNGNIVPYITIDQLAYTATAPWPATAPATPIRRISTSVYGNTPENWQAGTLVNQ